MPVGLLSREKTGDVQRDRWRLCPKSTNFWANCKVLWGLTEAAPVFSEKLHLYLLEAPDEVLELFHAHYFVVLGNLLSFLLGA